MGLLFDPLIRSYKKRPKRKKSSNVFNHPSQWGRKKKEKKTKAPAETQSFATGARYEERLGRIKNSHRPQKYKPRYL